MEDMELGAEITKDETAEEIDYKDLYIKTLADYQNLKRRQSKDLQDTAMRSGHQLIRAFIPIYHDAKRGSKYGEQGATLIYNKFVETLMKYGIGPIDENFFKKKFDGAFTDDYATAIGTEDTEAEELDNKIFSVVEDGFFDIRNNTVIDHAKVIVFKYKIE